MTSMIEKVARAICAEVNDEPYESLPEIATHLERKTYVDRPILDRDEARLVARAAIEAMCEPTTEQLRGLIRHRGYDPDAKAETLDGLANLDIATMGSLVAAYKAMVQAALNEQVR